MQIKISQEQPLYVFLTTECMEVKHHTLDLFNKQSQVIKNNETGISAPKSWILGNCRWRAGTQQLLYVAQTALTLRCSHLMWQGSYAFPKAAPRAYSPWAVIKMRCLLRHFKDKAGERRAMWFTTLLDKSHDAPRPFAKYPVLSMTADRSAVLGEQNRKEVFGALPLFQKNYGSMKMHSQEHPCREIWFWCWVL